MLAETLIASPVADSTFDAEGFAVRERIVSEDAIEGLLAELTTRGRSPNLRGLLHRSRMTAAMAASGPLSALAGALLNGKAFPVRTLLFDKVAHANWGVAWHQDLAVPVHERRETPGFSGWSVKDGTPHALAPDVVLAGMVTLRLHLDDCTLDNGPLRVLPGTHRHGRLDDRQIDEFRSEIPEQPIVGPAGTVFAMRPLLLHASSPALNPRHRRVLHIEYAADLLPGQLKWPELASPASNQAHAPR